MPADTSKAPVPLGGLETTLQNEEEPASGKNTQQSEKVHAVGVFRAALFAFLAVVICPLSIWLCIDSNAIPTTSDSVFSVTTSSQRYVLDLCTRPLTVGVVDAELAMDGKELADQLDAMHTTTLFDDLNEVVFFICRADVQ